MIRPFPLRHKSIFLGSTDFNTCPQFHCSFHKAFLWFPSGDITIIPFTWRDLAVCRKGGDRDKTARQRTPLQINHELFLSGWASSHSTSYREYLVFKIRIFLIYDHNNFWTTSKRKDGFLNQWTRSSPWPDWGFQGWREEDDGWIPQTWYVINTLF